MKKENLSVLRFFLEFSPRLDYYRIFEEGMNSEWHLSLDSKTKK